MRRLFLSYRRDDSKAITGRIYDRLIAHFGPDMIFIDIDNIPIGTDFRNHIDNMLCTGDVLVPIIGTAWLGSRNDASPRIFEATDPVRVEIQTALERKLKLIPVLVDGAKMPLTSELPDQVQELAYRNAVYIELGRDFDTHVTRLIRAAEEAVGRHNSATPLKSEVDRSHTGSAAGMPRILASVIATIVAILLTHYVLLFKLDTNTTYLQLTLMTISFVFGIYLQVYARAKSLVAIFAAGAVSLFAVVGMLAIVALLEDAAFVPVSTRGWQEMSEFFFLLTLGTTAGYALAHALAPFLRAKLPRIR